MANFKFKIGKSDDLLKSINETLATVEWESIEKARPVQYIKKIPNPNYKGKGDNKFKYFYKKDLLKPLKSLFDFFGIAEKQVNEDYEKNNIEKDYGVNKETWASHVLEFFVNKEKWTKLFGDKRVRDANKKPVKQEKVERAAGKPVTDPTNKKTKSSVINRSLMRKVWSIYSAEGKQTAATEITQVIPAEEKINDFVGRKTTIDKNTGVTTMQWNDGREIRTDKRGNIIYDSTNPKPVETVGIAARGDFDEYKISDNELEETKNRSDAMIGNDNAKKDTVTTLPETIVTNSEKLESDKVEFQTLIDRYNELNKEISSLGGYGYKRITTEEHRRKSEARKELYEVEKQIAALKDRIQSENRGMRIPELFKDGINAFLKRKVKGDTVSSDWIDKKFGGRAGFEFGDGKYEFNLGSQGDINNPEVRILYKDTFGRESFVSVEIADLINNENYRPRYMGNVDAEAHSLIYKNIDDLKATLDTTTGETPAEKFFNAIMGESNEFTKNAKDSNIPAYRFSKDGIKGKDGELIKVRYSISEDSDGKEYISMHADSYGSSIPSIFYPENNTDSQTDYFDKDSCVVNPDHPYYNHVLYAAKKDSIYNIKNSIRNKLKELKTKIEKVKEYQGYVDNAKNETTRNYYQEILDSYKEDVNDLPGDIEKQNDGLKKLEKEVKKLEGKLKEPTETQLKKYREKRDVEEAAKAKWEEAEKAQYYREMEKRRAAKEEEEKNKASAIFTQIKDTLEKRAAGIWEEPIEVDQNKTPWEQAEERYDKLQERKQAQENAQTILNGFRDVARQQLENQSEMPKEETPLTFDVAYGDKLGKYGINAGEENSIKTTLSDPNNLMEILSSENPNMQASEILMRNNRRLWTTIMNSPERGNESIAEILKPIVDEVVNENPQVKPTVTGSESEASANRSAAMMGNQNARKDGITVDESSTNVTSENDIVTPIPTIDRNTVQRVNDISMSGRSGEIYQHDVKAEMENFRDMFDTSDMNEQQKAYFQERLNSYAGLVGSSYNEMASKRLAAGPSWVVAGPAKYNNARFAKKMDSERRAYENFAEKKEKFIKNTEKQLKALKYTGGAENEEDVKKRVFDDYANGNYSYGDKIDNADPYAIEKISGKIKFLENAHDVTLMYRKACKKVGLSTWSFNDTPEESEKRKDAMRDTINAAKEKGYNDGQIKHGINHPFPQNQNQDIARNKQRLEEMQKRKAAIETRAVETVEGGSSANAGRVDFEGGYVYENLEMDRIQIIYDGKPDRETINKLKSNGFRWSPSQGAWQRQLNRNGRMAVNRVFSETGIDKKIDIDGAGLVERKAE